MSSISNSSSSFQIGQWQQSFQDLQESVARLKLEENLQNLDSSDLVPAAVGETQELINGLIYLAEIDQTTGLIADLKKIQETIGKAVKVFEKALKYKKEGCCKNLGQLAVVLKHNPINILKTNPLKVHLKERIKICNKIISDRMISLGKQLAIESHQPSTNSESSTSAVSQQTGCSLQSYVDELQENEIAQGSLSTPVLEENVEKNSLLIFPNEVLLNIAQYLKSPKDFFNLSLACKRLFRISKMQGAFQCDISGYIPNFLYLSNDPKVRSLLPKEVCLMTSKFERCTKKIKDPLTLRSLCKFDRRNYDPVAIINTPKFEEIFPPYLKATFGDILVIANHSNFNSNTLGTILIHDLKNNIEGVVKVHDTNVFACVAVHAPVPQLVTLSENEYKIWDMIKLQSGLVTEALVSHKTNVDFALSDCASKKNNNRKDPVIHVHNNYLAIGCVNSVLLIDFSRDSSNNSVEIESEDVRQVVISDSELILVDGNNILLWNMETVKGHLVHNLPLDYMSVVGYWTLDRVKFVEIIKDMIFVAFKYDELWQNEDNSFTYGQVYDITTGELIRNLNLKEGKKGEIFSVDFSRDRLITAGDFIASWDLNAQEDFPSDINDNLQGNQVFKTYVIGKIVLYATAKGLLCSFKDDLSFDGGINGVINASSCNPKNDKDKLVAFDFFGKYLFTQVRTECHQNLSRVYLIA